MPLLGISAATVSRPGPGFWLRALIPFILSLVAAPASAQLHPTPASSVRAILNGPEANLDYFEAAIAFDRLIDVHSDSAASRALVARLIDAARQMAGPRPNDAYKLAAVRQAI